MATGVSTPMWVTSMPTSSSGSQVLHELGKSQQAEIRSSFKQVIEKAAQQGFTVTAWTLCVPSVLPPDQQKWFDNWSKKQSRETGVRIDLWNGVRIRAALQQADARYLRELYFPDHAPAGSDVPVAALANSVVLSDALFVVQLEAAGRMETNHASAVAESAPTPIMRVGSKAVSSRRSLLRRSPLTRAAQALLLIQALLVIQALLLM